MSKELNAVCDICGRPYKVCRTCKEIKEFIPWRTVTDTLQHYQIFLVLSEYTKTKDKEEAKERLSNCDLSDLETFNERVKTVIKEIIEEPENKSQKKSIKKSKTVSKQNKTANKDIE